MSEIERLRNEARKRRAAVTAKASRLRKQGVEITGSNVDPRLAPNAINNMRSRELRSYIRRLNEFTDRRNQFVAGDRGKPLPREAWNSFASKQAQLRRMAEAHARDVGRYAAFGTEESVQEVRNRRHPVAQGGRTRGPFSDTDYRSVDITSAKALKELDAHLRKMFSPNFLKKKVFQGRANVIEAFKQMGELELIEMVSALTDYQFEVLWYDPRFAETVFAKYDAEKSRMQGNRKEQAQDRVADDQFQFARDFLDWASTQIPKTRPKAGSEATERIRGFRR